MEASKSETKKRVLPPWMTAQEIPRVVKTPKKRKAVTPASAMSRPTLKTVYCMNEAELVDEALKILLEARQQEVPTGQLCLKEADKPELSPFFLESASSGSESEDKDLRKDPLCSGRGDLPSGMPEDSESSCNGSTEDDALKYVREIFFS